MSNILNNITFNVEYLNIQCNKWIQVISLKYSKATIYQYSREIIRFINHVNHIIENNDNSCFVVSYLKYLSHKSSIAKAIPAIRSFYKFINYQFPKISTPKIHPNVIDVFSQDEMLCKLNQIKIHRNKYPWIQTRNYTIAVLLYGCGIRISECMEIKINNLKESLQTGFLMVHGKGDKIRYVPIIDFVKHIIEKYINERPYYNEYAFISNNNKKLSPRDMQRFFKQFQINPHKMRHTFATHMIQQGIDIISLKSILGHSNLNTTAHYAQVNFHVASNATKDKDLETI